METRNQDEVKERLFAEFIPLGIEASVIELIIDECSYNEDQSRYHLSTMGRHGRRRNSPPMPHGGPGPAASGRRNSPPESQPGPAASGRRSNPPASQPGPAASGRRSNPPASQPGPAASGRQNNSLSARAGRGNGEYSRQSPRTPAPAASSDSSTPLQQKLAAGVPLLILMRGLPGSGKSTLAKQMAGQDGLVFSADDFFSDQYGTYFFRPERLRDAHDWCQNKVRQALRSGHSPVIVDNTNTQMWEMKEYMVMAAELDYYVEIAEPTTPWRHDPKLLSKRSVHSVPEHTIENMMGRYQGSDRVNVPALYRMVGKEPKPWPPPAVASGAMQMDVAAAAAPARAQEVPPTPSPAPAPVSSSSTQMDTAAAAAPAKAQEAPLTPSMAPVPAPSPPPPSEEKVITLAEVSAAVSEGWAAIGAATTQRLWSPARNPATFAASAAASAAAARATAAAAAAAAPQRTEAGSQTGGGAEGRVVSPRPWQGAPDSQDGPPPLTVPLHRGTMTSPPPDLAADCRLDELHVVFPTVSGSDLQHVLDQCGGDVTWATNLLLDGTPPTPAAEEPAAQPAAESAAEAPVPSPAGQGGARPKQPQPQLPRQDSSDSGPDVIVENSSDSEEEAARPAAVLQPPQWRGRPADSLAAAVDSVDDSSGSSSDESTPPVSADELSLQLPARFAYQLQELFGPTTLGIRTEAQLAALSAAELTVRLPVEVARRLHHCWATGADEAFDAEQHELRVQMEEMHLHMQEEARQNRMRNDEAIARQLQQEEDDKQPGQGGAATSPTPQLRQIMAEQHVQRNEQTTGGPSTQADRLTRQRLRDEFPGVDRIYLDELLDMHDGDYRQALRVLAGTRGERPLPTAAIRPPSPPPAAAGGAVGGRGYAAKPRPDFLVEDGMPSFDDIRAESEICRQKITHAKMMAERALRRSDYSTSQYYVDERDRLYKQLNECNVRATITTMELQQGADPNRLDLHRLLVEDAKDQLASFIADRQNAFGRQSVRSKTVEIITGKGINSKNRKPKIKPAVEQWLENKGFQFREAENNSGMLIVTVNSEHLYRPQN